MLEIGTVAKPHGLRGDVVVALVDDDSQRLVPGLVVQAGERELVLVRAQRHQKRWIVHFEGLDDRAAAEALHGAVLRAPAGDEPGLWVHELVGLEVVTLDGERCGAVVSVQANPAHDLLVLDSGALVPVVFVVGEPADGRLRIDPPQGLFDL
jgi:16S rRNA processing protein RimM